jgi:hypothetical protein
MMILRLKLILVIIVNLTIFEFHSQALLVKKKSEYEFKVSEISGASDNFTFKSSRIINGHSPDVIEKKSLLMKIDHRFGDIAGGSGGVQNLFGLDNSSDIRIGFDYGITNKLNVGIGRSKGTGNPQSSSFHFVVISLLDFLIFFNISKLTFS